MEETLGEAAAIDATGLMVEDRITRDVIRVVCELQIEQDDQRIDQLKVVDQISGPQTLLPQVAQFQKADTPERLEKFLARLRADGLLAPKPKLAKPLSREEWERQRREFDEWLDTQPFDSEQLLGLLAHPSSASIEG